MMHLDLGIKTTNIDDFKTLELPISHEDTDPTTRFCAKVQRLPDNNTALHITVHGYSGDDNKIKTFEMFEEGSQVRRSAKAITAAVVEGYGRRRYKLDFSKYLVLAQAECDETILHLEFLHETKSLTDDNLFHELKSAYETLGKMITRFHQWMDQNWKTPNQ